MSNIEWKTSEEAKNFPEGCVVLTRRVTDVRIYYDVQDYFRPDWVDTYTMRLGDWSWAIIE